MRLSLKYIYQYLKEKEYLILEKQNNENISNWC